MKNLILMLSDARGVYIPRDFVDDIDCARWNVTTEQKETLAKGPDVDGYWETWDDVLNNAEFKADDGRVYRLHQDGDLWAVCYDGLTDKEYTEFFGECRHCGRYGCYGECTVDYWLCPDCLMVAVNGDYSGIESAAQIGRINTGLSELGNIACTDHEEEFSGTPCDCCGALPGQRFGFKGGYES